jgi:hypothetical protein
MIVGSPVRKLQPWQVPPMEQTQQWKLLTRTHAEDDCMHENINGEIHALGGDPTNDPEPLDLALLVLRWFRLHVSHFAALDDLLSFFHGQPLAGKTVRIHLLAVRSLLPHTAEWELVLQRVLKDDFALRNRIPEAINIICTEIANILDPRHCHPPFSGISMTKTPSISCAVSMLFIVK